MNQFSSLVTGSAKNINLLDPNEVSANRMGQITETQEKRLKTTVLSGGCSVLVVPILLGFFFLFILLMTLADGSLGWFMLIPLVFFGVIALSFSGALIDWIQLNSKLKIDRANKIIRSAVGELSFDRKKGYVVRAGEQTLRLPPSSNAGGLLPGARYNFYYLPESTIVLSAEQLGTYSTSQARNALTNILAIANDFTLEDLQANQQNEITSRQRGRLLRKGLLGLVPVLFLGLMFLAFFATIYSQNGSDLNEFIMPFIFMGFIFLVFGVIAAWGVINSLLDMGASVPEMIEGVGTKTSRQKGSGRSRRTVYYYVIEGKEFEVTQTAYKALLNNQTYRVYYTPRTNRLLSIEATGGSESPFN